jgi:hypothetical protein
MEGFRAYSKTTAESSLLRYLAVTNLHFSVWRWMVRRLQGRTRKKGIASHKASVLTLNACAVFCLAYLPACSRLRAGFVVICSARIRPMRRPAWF